MQDVRLSDNPLTDQKTGTATRFMLIARIGNLTCLNGSSVRSIPSIKCLHVSLSFFFFLVFLLN
jgi:hypothetical protein